jgi:hypothetical protein
VDECRTAGKEKACDNHEKVVQPHCIDGGGTLSANSPTQHVTQQHSPYAARNEQSGTNSPTDGLQRGSIQQLHIVGLVLPNALRCVRHWHRISHIAASWV